MQKNQSRQKSTHKTNWLAFEKNPVRSPKLRNRRMATDRLHQQGKKNREEARKDQDDCKNELYKKRNRRLKEKEEAAQKKMKMLLQKEEQIQRNLSQN